MTTFNNPLNGGCMASTINSIIFSSLNRSFQCAIGIQVVCRSRLSTCHPRWHRETYQQDSSLIRQHATRTSGQSVYLPRPLCANYNVAQLSCSGKWRGLIVNSCWAQKSHQNMSQNTELGQRLKPGSQTRRPVSWSQTIMHQIFI